MLCVACTSRDPLNTDIELCTCTLYLCRDMVCNYMYGDVYDVYVCLGTYVLMYILVHVSCAERVYGGGKATYSLQCDTDMGE